nr:hypothetical protein [Bacteroidota bacterium]
MEQGSKLSDISLLISKLNNDWNRITIDKNSVSRIDKDILIDDIRILYDLIFDLETQKYQPRPISSTLESDKNEKKPDIVIEENDRPVEELAVPKNNRTNHNEKQHSATTLDLFTANKTLADVYLDGTDNSLATKMQKNKVNDIKSIIGINDKFLFINEIFNGELLSYNQAIEQLNLFAHYHEALQYLDDIKLKNGTKENQAAFSKLLEITKRKYY